VTQQINTINAQSIGQTLKKRLRPGEMLTQAFLFLCGAVSILTTIGIVYELGKESLNFFGKEQWETINKETVSIIEMETVAFEVETSGTSVAVGEMIRIGDEIMEVIALDGMTITVNRGFRGTEILAYPAGKSIYTSQKVSLLAFFTKTEWSPQIGKFGIWPLLNTTLMTTLSAMLIALPIGLSVAIYLSEYAAKKTRSTLKPLLEVLAGIPTVVYGYFALTFMTPLLRSIFGIENVQIYNTAAAGIVIGILIIPLVSSMSEDALRAVPDSLRQASYGLGATKLETTIKVVLPAAMSGVVAAFIVAISRAIGETMIVAIAAGAGSAFTFNPFESAETMTGHIVRISGGDLSYDSIDYNSIFAIGLLLFFFTLSLNVISQKIVKRFREVYE